MTTIACLTIIFVHKTSPCNWHAWGSNPPCCYAPYRFLLATYLAWMPFQVRMCASASTFHMHIQHSLVYVSHYLFCTFPIDGDSRCLWGPMSPPLGLTLISAAAGEEGSQLRLMLSSSDSVEGPSLKRRIPLNLCTNTASKCWGSNSLGGSQLATSYLVLWADGSGRRAGHSAFRS